MEPGNPAFWVNLLSFLVINGTLLALVVLAVAGFVTSRTVPGHLTPLSRRQRRAAPAGASPAQVVTAR